MEEPVTAIANGFEVSGPPADTAISGSPTQSECEQGCLDRNSCQFVLFISAPTIACLLYDTTLTEYTTVPNANAVLREKRVAETGEFDLNIIQK